MAKKYFGVFKSLPEAVGTTRGVIIGGVGGGLLGAIGAKWLDYGKADTNVPVGALAGAAALGLYGNRAGAYMEKMVGAPLTHLRRGLGAAALVGAGGVAAHALVEFLRKRKNLNAL